MSFELSTAKMKDFIPSLIIGILALAIIIIIGNFAKQYFLYTAVGLGAFYAAYLFFDISLLVFKAKPKEEIRILEKIVEKPVIRERIIKVPIEVPIAGDSDEIELEDYIKYTLYYN
ncbi:hypothetical protein HY643_01580, partial [Candidatus Woesearchaeota archaeon]|nr:hypothetical protein [Candidatus Woesearchaeota archaeon]